MIRQPIITVLGHVDAGKTLLLDRIRGTAIAEKEAGAITQHIGATEVPIDVIEKLSGQLLAKYGFKLEIPGLLFIDTPGHEAFTNLRKRGGSIADLAVLVIDVMPGIQQQTVEAIDILKGFKVPFIVALNKTDKVFEWNSEHLSFTESLERQSEKGKRVLDEKLYAVVGQLHEHGFQSERFDRCSDFTKEIPIVPISAKTGEGLAELLMLLAGLSQKFLKRKLQIHEEEAGKGTVLEVREERGLGKTIDVILYEGKLGVNDDFVVAGRNGVIKTKIRALLKPKPMQEILHSSDRFKAEKIVAAASGVKIAAPGLDEAIAGSPLYVVKAGNEDEVLKSELKGITLDSEANGPIVRADTLGSLEAILMLLGRENLKARKADVGDVIRRDIMEAESVKEADTFKGIVFAFNVKVAADAGEEARKRSVKIFKGNVIYKLIEDYRLWIEEQKQGEKRKALASAALPAKVRFLPNCVFRHSKPAIIGVSVLEGKLRSGVKLMNKKGKIIGKVEAIQSKSESIEQASKGEEAAISIAEGVVGRNLHERDELYVYIPKRDFGILKKFETEFNAEELELLEEIKKISEKLKEEVDEN